MSGARRPGLGRRWRKILRPSKGKMSVRGLRYGELPYIEDRGVSSRLSRSTGGASLLEQSADGSCQHGYRALKNDRSEAEEILSNPESECCPSSRIAENWGRPWCVDLQKDDRCIFDEQCAEGLWCAGSSGTNPSSSGRCRKRGSLEVGAVASGNDAIRGCPQKDANFQGIAGRWDADGEERCCPTTSTYRQEDAVLCRELREGSGCALDEQCESGWCAKQSSSVPGVCTAEGTLPPGEKVSSKAMAKACAHGVAGAYGSGSTLFCCPGTETELIQEVAHCKGLVEGDACSEDLQCAKGWCNSSKAACDAPKSLKHGKIAGGNDALKGCAQGKAGIFNRADYDGTKCCATLATISGDSYCVSLENGEACSVDQQCATGYCAGAGNMGAVCKQRPNLKSGEEVEDGDETACASQVAALWNDRASKYGKRCCPTQQVVSQWDKDWCRMLPPDSACVFDRQCESGWCNGSTLDAPSGLGVCGALHSLSSGEALKGDAQRQIVNATKGCPYVDELDQGIGGFWRRSDTQLRCCPGKNFISAPDSSDEDARFCADLPTTNGCTYNSQCTSGYCSTSGGGVCTEKHSIGVGEMIASTNDANYGCEKGKAGIWNREVSLDKLCCPTESAQIREEDSASYCVNLGKGSACSFDSQCTSLSCEGAGTKSAACA